MHDATVIDQWLPNREQFEQWHTLLCCAAVAAAGHEVREGDSLGYRPLHYYSYDNLIFSVVITLVSEEDGSNALLYAVVQELMQVGYQINVNITIEGSGVQRFGIVDLVSLIQVY